jgi:DNA-binding NarL/FixJ family response regulator
VLVLTTYTGDDTILPALRAGAHRYLTKDASAEQTEAAIRAIHAGQTHPGPLAQERLAAAVTGPPPEQAAAGAHPLPAGLTTREAEMLTLHAAGLSNAEIAQRLFASNATMKIHINPTFAKTAARDRPQAARHAYRTGPANPAPGPLRAAAPRQV